MDPSPTTVLHHHYQDSVESSSPTCRQWDDTLPPPKLRMMCSYGGHIIPRPHDKSLCYMGGETRIVVADRHTSLSDLCSRLSTTLLNGRRFSLKYQLPSEDLDSLVSVTTEEDLDNMIEEYDRLKSSNPSSKPSRLRLFLFLTKPETAASMGSLLDDAKSETWFVDALNGLPRGLSDSATIDNLLEHKDNVDVESETQQRPNNLLVALQLPEVETTSSFGSAPSMSPIKVKVVDQMAGLDERLKVGGWATPAVSDDHGVPASGTRKPPLPLQRKFANEAYSLPSPDSKHGGAYGLHSPDSIASDSSSIASANCESKSTFTQDPNSQSNGDSPTPGATTQVYPIPSTTIINYQIPIQETSLTTQDQQQFYQPRSHFIQHHTSTPNQPVVSSYYQVYAQPPPQIDNQQYPLYFLPVTSQNHHYNGTMQLQSDAAATNPTSVTSSPPLKPDMAANPMHGTTTHPGMLQLPSNQFQQQYLNVSQIPHHPPTATTLMPSQYQTMTPGSAMLLSSAQPQATDRTC